MKRSIPRMVLPLCVCFLLLMVSNAYSVQLTFNTDTTDLMVGAVFDVDLVIAGEELKGDYLSSGNDLGAFDLIINYDSSMLSFNSYSLGNQLGIPINPDPFNNPDPINYDAEDWSAGDIGGGQINVAENTWLLDLSLQQDMFTIGTISFTAIAAGTTSLGISNAILGDYLGEKLLLDNDPGIQLDITQPVPEPATMLLLASGLFGAGVFSRRRKKLPDP